MLEWEKTLSKDKSVKKLSLKLNTAKISHLRLLFDNMRTKIDNMDINLNDRNFHSIIRDNSDLSETTKEIIKIIALLTRKSK